MNNTSLRIRLANNQDQDGIINLIDSVFREYDDAVNLDGCEANLLDIEKFYFAPGGAFWVLVDSDERIVGTHACVPVEQSHASIANELRVCTFKRLYLAQALRGTEWSHRLMQVTIDWAADTGFNRIEFWSDSRFKRAHKFFPKFGFETEWELRTMNDGHAPYQEYFFWLNLENSSA